MKPESYNLRTRYAQLGHAYRTLPEVKDEYREMVE